MKNIKHRNMKVVLLTSCAFAALNSANGAQLDRDETTRFNNTAPVGVNQVTVSNDQGERRTINIGASTRIENIRLGDTGFRQLLTHLNREDFNLTELSLRNVGITSNAIHLLLRGNEGSNIRNLITLDLSNNPAIGEQGAAFIANQLGANQRLSNLGTLILENTGLNEAAALALTGASTMLNHGGRLHDSRITSLQLGGNSLGRGGVHELVRRGRLPDGLIELDLRGNNLDLATVRDLFDASAHRARLPESLRLLGLANNVIQGAIEPILRGDNTQRYTNLTIDLSGNPLSTESIQTLRDACPAIRIQFENQLGVNPNPPAQPVLRVVPVNDVPDRSIPQQTNNSQHLNEDILRDARQNQAGFNIDIDVLIPVPAVEPAVIRPPEIEIREISRFIIINAVYTPRVIRAPQQIFNFTEPMPLQIEPVRPRVTYVPN
jgi:hypothetical protein